MFPKKKNQLSLFANKYYTQMAAIAVHQFAQCITCHAWSPDRASKSFFVEFSDAFNYTQFWVLICVINLFICSLQWLHFVQIITKFTFINWFKKSGRSFMFFRRYYFFSFIFFWTEFALNFGFKFHFMCSCEWITIYLKLNWKKFMFLSLATFYINAFSIIR